MTHFYAMYESSSKVHLINHFKYLQEAGEATGAEINLDCTTFHVQVKFQQRNFTLFPQFLEILNDSPCYTSRFSHDAICFTGWRPYTCYVSDFFADKLTIKEALWQRGFRVPSYALEPTQIEGPVLVKRSRSSFGKHLRGPFQKSYDYQLNSKAGDFYEHFLKGEIVKLGFWNDELIYVEQQPMPRLYGDGKSTIEILAKQRAAQRGRKLNIAQLQTTLAFQELTLETILPRGQSILADFRYESDLAECFSIHELKPPVEELNFLEIEMNTVGTACFDLLQQHKVNYLFYTVDAILTPDGQIWLLELNTNPTVHQLAYPAILKSLRLENDLTQGVSYA